MAKMLPIVKIQGNLYFRDDRLEEFRHVNDPHKRILFKDLIVVIANVEGMKVMARRGLVEISDDLKEFEIEMKELQLSDVEKIELLRRESEKCLRKRR